jgi:hypothetical protein
VHGPRDPALPALPAAAAATDDAGACAYLAANRELVDLVDCSGLDIDTVADRPLFDRD